MDAGGGSVVERRNLRRSYDLAMCIPTSVSAWLWDAGGPGFQAAGAFSVSGTCLGLRAL
jgi:hypothetical protein